MVKDLPQTSRRRTSRGGGLPQHHENGDHDDGGNDDTHRSAAPTSSRQLPTSRLLVKQNGVVTINPRFITSFVVFGGMLLLGVHVYLFQQLKASSTATVSFSDQRQLQTQQQQQPQQRRVLTPLGPRDKEQFTIRINTWQRLDQLLVSIDHHASCPGVAQIQVVWCEPIDPPVNLTSLRTDKVVIERHFVNSLNERFHILSSTPTPTLGILSMDDDVLRPCEAIDSGFFQWTRSPSRFVGFDYRKHVEEDDGSWKVGNFVSNEFSEEPFCFQLCAFCRCVSSHPYRMRYDIIITNTKWLTTLQYGYLSTTRKANRYSMSLPRYAFLHRDYLDWYMTDLPRPIFDHVAKSFNCEDIAMSFFVSSLTFGKPPLLAHFWAIETMVKLYSPKKISGTKDHKQLRDACVESFAQQLHLKDRLYFAPVLHRNDTMFYCGDDKHDDMVLENDTTKDLVVPRQLEHFRKVDQWRQKENKEFSQVIIHMKEKTAAKAKLAGLIEHTEAWKKKYDIQDSR